MVVTNADLCRINPQRSNVLVVRRVLALAIVAALFVAACSSSGDESTAAGDGADPSTTTRADDDTQTSSAEDTTTTAPTEGTTDTTAEGTTDTTSGRPAAPDFTLELGDGGTYTLAEGSKPVYLVFWAEW